MKLPLSRFAAMVAVASAVSGGLAGAAAARPLVPAEQRYRPFTADLPACDDPGVLGTITSRFQQKESEYWNSALEIKLFDRVHESGFRSNGLDYIPRRYCTARALLNNDKRHYVTYWVGERTGIIGWSYGVEWCVQGLDRNNAYAPACRAARH